MRGTTHSHEPAGSNDVLVAARFAGADTAALAACHTQLRVLLDCVEDLADDLPDQPEYDACDRLCCALAQAVAMVVASQDRVFARMLDERAAPAHLRGVIDRIHDWRSADTQHLRDTIVALRRFAGGADAEDRVSADTLGYMLRCSFDGWRRLLDHVELVVLGVSGDRVGVAAPGDVVRPV